MSDQLFCQVCARKVATQTMTLNGERRLLCCWDCALAVQGEWGCPLVLHAFKPGDPVFADIYGSGGTYDATTNTWTGFALNGNTGGVLIGWTLDAIPAGSGTTTVRVVLK